MRITCPNCTAHFEIPTELLGKKGRSLKCASCGHSWYQTSQVETLDIADIMGQEYAERARIEMGAVPARPSAASATAAPQMGRGPAGPQAQAAVKPGVAGAPTMQQGPVSLRQGAVAGAPQAGPAQGQSWYQGQQGAPGAPAGQSPQSLMPGAVGGPGAMPQAARAIAPGAIGGPGAPGDRAGLAWACG